MILASSRTWSRCRPFTWWPGP